MSDDINLCFVDGMHQCSFSDWKSQRHCKFNEKSRFVTKCTHCHFDQFCQNLEAYPTAKTVRVKEEDLPKIYRGESEEVWGVGVLEQIRNAGKVLDEQDVPRENRILGNFQSEYAMVPHRIWKEGPRSVAKVHPKNHEHQYYSRESFVQAIIYHAECEIERRGYTNQIEFGEYLFDYKDHTGDVVRFKFNSKFESMFALLCLGHSFDDIRAKRFGIDIGTNIVFHHNKLEKEMIKTMTVAIPPSMIKRGRLGDVDNWR